MEPVELIVGALGAALANLAQPLVRKAYDDLKGLIKNRFGGNPKAEMTFDEFEGDPKTWKEPVKKSLQDINAAEDPVIRAAFEKLQAELQTLKSAGTLKTQTAGRDLFNFEGDITMGDVSGSINIGGTQTVHTGDTLSDQARKINTGGGDYVEGTQTKYTPGSTHIEQNISGASGSTIIGQQNRYGSEQEDE